MKISTIATIILVQCMAMVNASCDSVFKPKQLSIGSAKCATTSNGSTKCWGMFFSDELYKKSEFPNTLGSFHGDSLVEMGDNVPRMYFGKDRKVKKIVQSLFDNSFLCALFEDGGAVCFGNSKFGKTGQVTNVNEYISIQPSSTTPSSVPDMDFGEGVKVIDLAIGARHVCVILDNNELKCWGDNSNGQLGRVIDTPTEEDNYSASFGQSIDLGSVSRKPVQVSAGQSHTCVRFDDGKVKCFGERQAIGADISTSNDVGDDPDEMGDNLPIVDLGENYFAVDIQSGSRHNCAIFQDSSMKCWGISGDGATAIPLPVIVEQDAKDFGQNRTVTQISLGDRFTCVLLSDGLVKCFGDDTFGQLGHGFDRQHNHLISASKLKDSLPAVELPGIAIGVYAGQDSTCAILQSGDVYCWGVNGPLGVASSSLVERFARGPVNLGCDCALEIHESFGVCSPVTCDTMNGICELGSCFGAAGDGTCTSCKDGFVGLNCELPKTCNQVGGSCATTNCDNGCEMCNSEHFGKYCEYQVTCSAPGICDGVTCSGITGNGTCSDFSNCDEFAGPNCDIPITCSETHGVCGPECHGPTGNGHCSSCQEGYFGLDCASQVDCDVEHGTCDEGVERCYGIHGTGRCSSCNEGRYGKDCAKVHCNLENGKCGVFCKDFFGNGLCSSCKDGFFGNACEFNATCPTDTGVCSTPRCSGFKGDGECSSCKTGYFGTQCQQEVMCPDTGYCDFGCRGPTGDGMCTGCKVGKYGKFCNETATCNTSNGLCGSNCSPTGNGLCARCDIDYFGENCAEPVNCSNTTGLCLTDSCDGIKGNGSCTWCLSGWKGLDCTSKIPDRELAIFGVAETVGLVLAASTAAGLALRFFFKDGNCSRSADNADELVQDVTLDKSGAQFANCESADRDRVYSL